MSNLPQKADGSKTAISKAFWLDWLTDAERELHDLLDPSPGARAEAEVRLLTIREWRLLQRTQTTGAPALERLEDALTRVQHCKARYVEMLRRIEVAGARGHGDPLAELGVWIDRSRKVAGR